MLLVITACSSDTGGDNQENQNDGANNEVAEQNENNEENENNEDNGEEVTINFYSWQQESVNEEKIKNFEAENPGIKVNYEERVDDPVIDVTADDLTNNIKIEIADNGKGMSPEQIQHIQSLLNHEYVVFAQETSLANTTYSIFTKSCTWGKAE